MKIITAHSAASAWINATNTILKEGTKYGDLQEILNMVLEIECDSPNQISAFDSEFRNIFGDERIDYAKSVSFVQSLLNIAGPLNLTIRLCSHPL